MRVFVDNRFDELKRNKIDNYEDYLKNYEIGKIKVVIPFTYIIIGEILTEEVNLKIIETKIIYLAQVSKRLGIKLIYIVRKENYISNVIYSIFDYKLIFKTNKQLVNKINHDKNDYYQVITNSMYLEGNGDAYFASKNNYLRVCTPLITKYELDKIKNYYIK